MITTSKIRQPKKIYILKNTANIALMNSINELKKKSSSYLYRQSYCAESSIRRN